VGQKASGNIFGKAMVRYLSTASIPLISKPNTWNNCWLGWVIHKIGITLGENRINNVNNVHYWEIFTSRLMALKWNRVKITFTFVHKVHQFIFGVFQNGLEN